MKNLMINRLLIAGLILFSGINVFAQAEPQTRSITSDDFNSQRPTGNKPSNNKNKQQTSSVRRATYKLGSQNKKAVRRQSGRPKTQNSAKAQKVYEIGLTMWKLRPSRSSDNGYKLPVLVNKMQEMWTAERVSLDTIFQSGDRIRLAIESSISGYLYIINSEFFSEGGLGEPFLIFPDSETIDNLVKPGLLVDIPDQKEDLPYFLINPKNSNYKGELLTIIISPKPITTLRTNKDGKIINIQELIDLEDSSNTEIYNRNDLSDKIYSPIEAASACGAKTRQLTREKSVEKPCGEKTRQLTREEPLPQTIYRVRTAVGQPVVTFVQINVNQ